MFYRELFKFFVYTELKIPMCLKCIHYKPSYPDNKESYCKVYGKIVQARLSDRLCGIEGKYFVKQT